MVSFCLLVNMIIHTIRIQNDQNFLTEMHSIAFLSKTLVACRTMINDNNVNVIVLILALGFSLLNYNLPKIH